MDVPVEERKPKEVMKTGKYTTHKRITSNLQRKTSEETLQHATKWENKKKRWNGEGAPPCVRSEDKSGFKIKTENSG